jgi:hypothetical protein
VLPLTRPPRGLIEAICYCRDPLYLPCLQEKLKIIDKKKNSEEKKNLVLDLNLKNRFVLYKIESKRGIEIDNLFGFKNLKNQP